MPTTYAAVVSFPHFSTTTGLTLNGNATPVSTSDGAVLRLASADYWQSGSAFSTVTVNASTFSTHFRFRISDRGGTLFDDNTVVGADGLVFVVQPVSASIGGAGEGIGYEGISPSVGVEFDTWHNSYNNDPDSNHLGIDLNGNVDHGPGSPNTLGVTPDFDDGNIWDAWIDYDGTTLEVRANQTGVRPVAAMLSENLNISSQLGGVTDAYVGFTAGTGWDWGNHDIISWEYRDEYAPISGVPEPSTVIIWSLLGGLGVTIGWWRRRKAA
jgi:hypothetical protein